MSERTPKRAIFKLEYKVGLFVAIGLIAAAATIILIGSKQVMLASPFILKTTFDDVQGLFAGSVVSIAGVEAGNVRSIDFDKDSNALIVTMSVTAQYGSRITEGTMADVRTQGALGDKYIYLTPGKMGSKQLESGVQIPSTNTDFMKMITSREDGLGRVVDLIKEMHILVATLNQGKAGANLVGTIAELKSMVSQLKGELPQNGELRRTLHSLANVMEKIDNGQGSLGALINDPSVHQRLKKLLGGTSPASYLRDVANGSVERAKQTREPNEK